MKYILLAATALCGLAFAQKSAASQDAPVPHRQASYRAIAFENELLAILWMDIPAGKASNYHVHSQDMSCVVMEDYPPEGYTQPLNGPPGKPRKPKRGDLSYVSYFGKPTNTHRDVNPGILPMHQICLELNTANPQGFVTAERPAQGYKLEIDNDRVRAWRLTLEPGERAPAITQIAPGLRVVIDGGELEELSAGHPSRSVILRGDHFYWQSPGVTRSVRNTGTTRIELVEYEFK